MDKQEDFEFNIEKNLMLHKTSILRKTSVTVDIITKIKQPKPIPEMVTIKHANG